MNWRHYVILFIIGLIVPLAIAQFQELPGYMDADYYFAGGIELAKGNGFNESYIWNYLDDPQGLPHPSHTYWMPLASMISAVGMWIAGATTYAAGRLPFILLSACVPLLIASLAFDVSRNRLLAMVSGFLSIFSLYYTPFMGVPDNYAIFMLLGGAFLLLVPRNQKWVPFALGAISGFMTLARSDGLLWLGLAGLVVMWKSPLSTRSIPERDKQERAGVRYFVRTVIPAGLLALLGYFLIMGAWHYRNYSLFGSFMTPGGGRLLWLQNYNQTFSYPAESITRESFLEAGWSAAMDVRLKVLSANIGTAFAAQGEIFLFPLILIGLWQLRKELRTKIAVTGYLLLFLVMTFIFPFAGARGSFFHAGAAFQPMWWVAAPFGLNAVILWVRKRGRFTDKNAPYIFQGLMVVLAFIVTLWLVNFRVIANPTNEEEAYMSVEKIFLENGISPEVVVIVRNPPGYYISSGRPAIALPYGDESVILQVAERYGAGLLVLESSGTFESIQELYDHPGNNDAFIYLGEVDETKLYRIDFEN